MAEVCYGGQTTDEDSAYMPKKDSSGTDHIIVVLDLHLSIMVVDGWKGVTVLLTTRRVRDNR
jgi:nitrogen fixation protein